VSPITTLWLVRHGESTANVAASTAEAHGDEVIDPGARDADVPLSDSGRLQASGLGQWLSLKPERPDQVWVSPYRRARETLEIAARESGLEAPVSVDERLRDRELGVLDLLTSAGVERRLPEEAARRRWLGKFYYRPPGGESWTDVVLRLRSFLADADSDRFGARTLVVAHDAVVLLLLYVCLGLDEAELLDFARTHTVANASVTTLVRSSPSASWALDSFSVTDHLARRGAPITHHPGDKDASIH
jgi:broad specificity phosphatase PhoE